KLSKDVAGGGRGAPEGFNYDSFNQGEQEKYQSRTPEELLRMFGAARDSTLDWINNLVEGLLDRKGNHPALGEVTLEQMLSAIHGHILLHMRELP
ncbi:MAG: DinB family protein, partial [Anaerolineales bacterium]